MIDDDIFNSLPVWDLVKMRKGNERKPGSIFKPRKPIYTFVVQLCVVLDSTEDNQRKNHSVNKETMIKINKTGALSVQHIYNYKYESKQSKRSYFFNIFFLGIVCGAAFKELLVYMPYMHDFIKEIFFQNKNSFVVLSV